MATPWRLSGQVERVVPAAPEVVYAALADVTSTGTRSTECHTVSWLTDGPQEPVVGARFRGRNKVGLARWSRTCEVVAAEPGRRFAFRTLPERLDVSRADSTTWAYDLEPCEGGTRVRHSYEITKLPLAPFRAVFGAMMPHHKDMRPSMGFTLERLEEQVVSRRDAAPRVAGP